nr:nibrin [Vanessa tameamea]
MWHLTSENDKRIIFVLSGKNVTIGRSLDGQNCNFAITDDPSISRKHATLLILEGVLYLEDLGSKYGTFVNNSDKIEHNKMLKLSCNDVIKFGKMNCVWKAQKINLITCTSTMKGENLQSLKNILTTVGGIIKNEWDETCEYLTMPAITLTIKVVLALVQNSHIVTIDYWNKCVDAVNNNTALPNPSNFIPQILESTLNKESVSFLPSKYRSSLFASKKVIFFSRRQLELYKMVLTKSSATALLLSESKMTKSALCDEDVIVIQYTFSSSSQETQAQRDQINDIIEYLKNKGKRVVADAEIGLAILYCSTSKYCNPSFNFSSEVVKQLPCQNNNKNVLAPESQDSSEDLCKKENLLIDESLTPTNNQSFNNDNSNNTSKRKLSDDDNIANTRNLPKKFATDTFSKLSLSNSKKRQSEFNDLENPSKKIAVANNKDDDDMFNFVKNDNCKNIGENSFKKKLSLSKPMKRKHSTDNEEEDLFNFVNKENKKTALDKPSNSNSDSVQDTSHSHTNIFKTSKVIDDRFDISALRGSKLKELMLISSNTPCYKYIKKEEVTELDDKFGSIDLGSASLIVRKDLIIKREHIQVPLSPDNGLKNFKKFKKVWPSKMQVTVVSTSA